jgi:hypothetical protein
LKESAPVNRLALFTRCIRDPINSQGHSNGADHSVIPQLAVTEALCGSIVNERSSMVRGERLVDCLPIRI